MLSSMRNNIKQPPILFKETQAIIKKLEDLTGKRFITYWNSERGSVCGNDVNALYELFESIGYSENLGIFIKSSGGSIQSALRLVNLMRDNAKNITAYIPLESESAATMLALGADEIHMGPMSHLSAVDSSLNHNLAPIDERNNTRVSVSQDELSRLVRLWNMSSTDNETNPYSELFKYIHPLVIGASDRSSSLSIKVCQEILSYHLDDQSECERISKHLNSNYPSHSYPITLREAKKIGLKVTALDKQLNTILLDLNVLYSEMAQKAITDIDDSNYHDNEILNIMEGNDVKIYYQNDKDRNYISSERRWQTLNDKSSWRMINLVNGKKVSSVIHMR